jgi:hypothetical protein
MPIEIFDITHFYNNQQTNDKLFENIRLFFEIDAQNLECIYNKFSLENNFINEYRIDALRIEYNSKIINLNTYLLDLNKKKYNLLEKYIYDTAKYHFERLNIELTDKYDIEFWLIDDFNKNTDFHVDQQEMDRVLFDDDIRPFLTTVTYFNDHEHPTMITNITDNKDNLNEEMFLSFPVSGKQIAFDGHKFFHSPINIFNKKMLMNNLRGIKKPRYVLNIQFWEIKQKYRPYYAGPTNIQEEFNKEQKILFFNKQEDGIKTINVSSLEITQLFDKIKSETVKYDTFYFLEKILNENGYDKQSMNNCIILNNSS